jgi:hypothetical protein
MNSWISFELHFCVNYIASISKCFTFRLKRRGNAKSSWMSGDDFILFREHSIKHIMAMEETSEISFYCRGQWSGIIFFCTSYNSQNEAPIQEICKQCV